MITLRQLLRRTDENLNLLLEREAKLGLNVPLELINQISDHKTAIQLIEQALRTDLTDSQFSELKQELRRLLIATSVTNIEPVTVDEVRPEKPRLPFEPATVMVPEGPFLMGSEHGDPAEAPCHQVSLAAFAIGKYPVTNLEYSKFIAATGNQSVPKKTGWMARLPPRDKLDHPVVGLSWYDAQNYCRWLSLQTGRTYRLPTEAEWEKAASWNGEVSLVYPWGNEFGTERCNAVVSGIGDTTAVGSYSPQHDSPCGCADMAGNVQEWVNTLWGSDLHSSDFPYPYRGSDGREKDVRDQPVSRMYRLHRGGSFRDDAFRLRCAARGYSDPDSKLRWRGFRVALES